MLNGFHQFFQAEEWVDGQRFVSDIFVEFRMDLIGAFPCFQMFFNCGKCLFDFFCLMNCVYCVPT